MYDLESFNLLLETSISWKDRAATMKNQDLPLPAKKFKSAGLKWQAFSYGTVLCTDLLP